MHCFLRNLEVNFIVTFVRLVQTGTSLITTIELFVDGVHEQSPKSLRESHISWRTNK